MKRALSRKYLWDKTPSAVKSGLALILEGIPTSVMLGRRFRENLRFIKQAQWWDIEQCQAYQLAQLQRIGRLANDKCPYYRRIFHQIGFHPAELKQIEDLTALPTIDKQTLRQNLDEMCAVPSSSRGVDYISTGGSSGVPLYFYINASRSAIEYAYLLTSWERAGYRLGMPMAVFRGRVVKPDRAGLRHEYDPLLRHHYYSNYHMTDENMARYLKHVASIGECFLHVYPSSVATLARFINRIGMKAPTNIQGIIAESENVYPDQRKLVEEVFGCRYYSCYGHTEKLVLAAECEYSTDYHVWPTYGYFELLDKEGRPVNTPGQRGEIVGTGFINTVMPFIRYRTGDYATYVGDHCEACGRNHVIIRDLEGRWPSGNLVARDGSYISMTAINVHDDTFARVRQFQFYQNTPGRAVLRLVPAPGFDDSDQRRIHDNLGRKLDGRLTFTIQINDSIPLTPRGKAIYVDQRIPGIESAEVSESQQQTGSS
ncbi:MAG: phenylacetate--CoA ligase family protein [Phycisphaerales bacterium]|nr:phenylacetate--CoA ligase family protein [Phycisphaerales bacterium]